MEFIGVEVKSVAEIVGRRQTLPNLQREYSWKADHCEDFLNDIMEFNNDKNRSKYFMGNIIVYRTPENTHEVVDGQQRLGSFALLFYALRDHLDSLRKRWDGQNSDFTIRIGSDRETLNADTVIDRIQRGLRHNETNKSFLTLNKDDRKRLDFLSQKISDRGAAFDEARQKFTRDRKCTKKAAHHLRPERKNGRVRIYNNYDIFLDFFEGLEHNKQGNLSIAAKWTFNFWQRIKNNVVFTETTVVDLLSAYTIFSAINTTGMPLTLFDVIRAEILGVGSKKNFETSSVENLNQLSSEIPKEPKDHQSLFVRRYWIMNKGQKMTSDKVQKQIIQQIRKYTDELELDVFCNKLGQYGKFYCDLLFPNRSDNSHFSNTYLNDLYYLADSSVESHIPFLMAVRSRGFEEKEESELFKLIEGVWIMHNICRRGKWNAMDNLYASLCSSALDKSNDYEKIKSVFLKDSFQILFSSSSDHGEYNSQKFIDDFAKCMPLRVNQQRVILRRIEQELASTTTELKENEIHVEHILPKKPAKSWPDFSDKEKHENYLNRLGNLTLLHSKLNIKISNSDFSKKKKEGFEESKLKITNQLCEFKQWTAEEIDLRQQKMAQKVNSIWPYFDELSKLDTDKYGHLVTTGEAE